MPDSDPVTVILLAPPHSNSSGDPTPKPMAETKIGRFLGVRRRPAPPARFPWCARVEIASGKVEHISSFKSPRQAAEAYDRAVLHYFGAGAPRNFPKNSLSPANAATLRAEIRLRAKANTSSKYFGVHRDGSRWCAQIAIEGRPVFLGNWRAEREAAEAYDRAVLFFRTDRSRLNFPNRHLRARPPSDLRKRAYASFKARTASRFRGVRFRPAGTRRPWVATLAGVGPTNALHLGTWEVEEDAARAYDRAARFYVCSGSRLNFPEQKLEPADAETLMAEAQREAKKGQTSRYIGVSWNKQANRWVAVINHQWKHITLGFFNDERAAAEAYDDKAIELRGPRARLNFDPQTGDEVWGMRLRVLPVAQSVKQPDRAL